MFGVSGGHVLPILILLIVVLIIFGPGKLPEIGSGMGRAIREFKKASSDVTDSVHSAVHDAPVAPAAPSAAPAQTTTVVAPPAAPAAAPGGGAAPPAGAGGNEDQQTAG